MIRANLGTWILKNWAVLIVMSKWEMDEGGVEHQPEKQPSSHPQQNLSDAQKPRRWENMNSSSIPMLIMEFRCQDVRLDKNRVARRRQSRSDFWADFFFCLVDTRDTTTRIKSFIYICYCHVMLPETSYFIWGIFLISEFFQGHCQNSLRF